VSDRRSARGDRRAHPRHNGRRLLPDGRVDEAPDVCSVRRTSPGVFEVKHYPDEDAETPCCSGTIETNDADRSTAAAEGIHVDIVTLRRCDVAFNKKHEAAAASTQGAAASNPKGVPHGR
jgi:hypothetical protein